MLWGKRLYGAHLTGGDETAEEERRHQREQQGDASRQDKADNQRHLQLLLLYIITQHLFQRQHRQQGDGELCNHQDRRHRAELRIHGHIVEEEVGKAHEVSAP